METQQGARDNHSHQPTLDKGVERGSPAKSPQERSSQKAPPRVGGSSFRSVGKKRRLVDLYSRLWAVGQGLGYNQGICEPGGPATEGALRAEPGSGVYHAPSVHGGSHTPYL